MHSEEPWPIYISYRPFAVLFNMESGPSLNTNSNAYSQPALAEKRCVSATVDLQLKALH